jgi:DDE superfamily endonuclease
VVSYRVMLDVPRELVLFVSGLLAARRREIGTRKGTRKLGCYRQALFALAWFRDKGSIPRLGAGFGLAQSTAYRYLDEVIDVLAARAPGLRQALERALAEGTPYVILDGKVVAADRCREKTLSRKGTVIDLWYSGKTHDFGGNIQALFYPDGRPMWISDVLPGNVHDLAAARENVLAVYRARTRSRVPWHDLAARPWSTEERAGLYPVRGRADQQPGPGDRRPLLPSTGPHKVLIISSTP